MKQHLQLVGRLAVGTAPCSFRLEHTENTEDIQSSLCVEQSLDVKQLVMPSSRSKLQPHRDNHRILQHPCRSCLVQLLLPSPQCQGLQRLATLFYICLCTVCGLAERLQGLPAVGLEVFPGQSAAFSLRLPACRPRAVELHVHATHSAGCDWQTRCLL